MHIGAKGVKTASPTFVDLSGDDDDDANKGQEAIVIGKEKFMRSFSHLFSIPFLTRLP